KDVPILDADGRPFVAQAPQPLLTGRQGVPEHVEPIEWEIAQNSLDDIKNNPLISVATTQISMDEARQLSAGDDGLMGIGNVGGLLGGGGGAPGTGVNPSQDVQQPIDINVPPPPPPPPPIAGNQD